LTKWWQRRDVSYGIFSPILAYLNKIEPWWFVLKNGMKRWDELERFRDGVDAAFKQSPNVSA
jgi:hypothetical protein